jgi:hypothetical protein
MLLDRIDRQARRKDHRCCGAIIGLVASPFVDWVDYSIRANRRALTSVPGGVAIATARPKRHRDWRRSVEGPTTARS